jgi:hypothetical protein
MRGNLRGSLARAKALARGLLFRIFHQDSFYLHSEDLHLAARMKEADYLPRIEEFTFKVVRSSGEADELAKATGHDFRSRFFRAASRLDEGATAFCTVVNGEVINVGWLAVTERARRALFDVPIKVDFRDSECYLGGSETVPEYRGKGLMTYNSYQMYRFRSENEIKTARYAMSVSNSAARWQAAKFEPEIYAEGRFVRFLWWKYWKETPLAKPPEPVRKGG